MFCWNAVYISGAILQSDSTRAVSSVFHLFSHCFHVSQYFHRSHEEIKPSRSSVYVYVCFLGVLGELSLFLYLGRLTFSDGCLCLTNMTETLYADRRRCLLYKAIWERSMGTEYHALSWGTIEHWAIELRSSWLKMKMRMSVMFGTTYLWWSFCKHGPVFRKGRIAIGVHHLRRDGKFPLKLLHSDLASKYQDII